MTEDNLVERIYAYSKWLLGLESEPEGIVVDEAEG